MRLIDADAYEIEINQRLNDCMTLKIDAQNFDSFLLADGALIAYSQTKMVLDDMPTVDAVEVVLCKDCKHYEPDDLCGNSGGCKSTGLIVVHDWYCADGERREANDGRRTENPSDD